MTRASTKNHRQSVAHAVLRCSDARRSCSMCGPITACGLANRRAFLCRRPEQSARKAAGQWSFTQASPANPNPSRSRTTRHVKQHRFANPPPHAGSCTVAFPGAVFRYLGSKPSRPGPAKGSFPHAFAGGALGVLVLRRTHCHWSADVSKASFSSPCADVPALGLSLANWL